MGGLQRGFAIALVLIYALLAVPLKSYAQPLVIMSAIPFGIVGAVWGHMIMGSPLTILSMFGIVALAGVVVNDSLVMVDFINRNRKSTGDLAVAVRNAGVVRFRPILLTSLTTFFGLLPLLLEKSMQAKFMVPMAISLGFGVVFSTVISLVLVPAGYMIMEDLKTGFGNLPGFLRRIYGLESTSASDQDRLPSVPEKETVGVDG
jgi:multidrug efflux pump subunit AcrB